MEEWGFPYPPTIARTNRVFSLADKPFSNPCMTFNHLRFPLVEAVGNITIPKPRFANGNNCVWRNWTFSADTKSDQDGRHLSKVMEAGKRAHWLHDYQAPDLPCIRASEGLAPAEVPVILWRASLFRVESGTFCISFLMNFPACKRFLALGSQQPLAVAVRGRGWG